MCAVVLPTSTEASSSSRWQEVRSPEFTASDCTAMPFPLMWRDGGQLQADQSR